MQFQVPQFIEVEDRVFGPLTVTQFIYLTGGFGFLGAMWIMLPLWAAILVGGPVAGLGAGLAFVKINERPLVTVIEHAVYFYLRDKLYIWSKRRLTKEELEKNAMERTDDPAQFVPNATGNKIKDLAWSLDIKESIYSDTRQK